jgi:26S proteasome regulatory subunit N2
VRSAADPAAALAYAQKAALAHVPSKAYRGVVLNLLVDLHAEGSPPDWGAAAQCLLRLDDAPRCAALLGKLLSGSESDALLALQVGFDLAAADARPFLARVAAALEAAAPPRPAVAATPAAAGGAAATPGAPVKVGGEGAGEPAAPAAPPPAPPPAHTPAQATYLDRHDRLLSVLTGAAPTALALDFLHARCAADAGLLAAAKAAVEPRNAVCHGAVVFANAAMHAGTTVDSFLRENLDWLARATNWAKFGATAGLGVVHRGNLAAGRTLMAPYLPRPGAAAGGGSPFSEGGALLALGLLGGGLASPDASFLLESLRGATAEPVQHGAALGLGAALLGTADAAAAEELRNTLFTDGAVAGEGAALGLGLLAAGAGPQHAAELVAYARDTQHEKIIRACALGAALTAYGAEAGADGLIDTLCGDADPLLR